jgi:hypothetical protein
VDTVTDALTIISEILSIIEISISLIDKIKKSDSAGNGKRRTKADE